MHRRVFSDAALVKYFIRVLTADTRDVVTETGYRLTFSERNVVSAVRRIALTEVNNYRSLYGKALRDIGANTQRTPRVRTPRAPSLSA